MHPDRAFHFNREVKCFVIGSLKSNSFLVECLLVVYIFFAMHIDMLIFVHLCCDLLY